MDRKRAKELLPIIQAYADGAEIEYLRLQCGDKPWESLGDNWFLHRFSDDGENFEYRIKPKAREFHIFEGSSGWCVVPKNAACAGMIKVREVDG